ncbi:DNA-binding GntR family transcriptional regulator [Rhodococcus sp. 27YEA15]|uniref:GntR family transcriptional regulator n=1 Tax=Rhodococcus sp. 27YEA15 TaxID=3156259 RepID=UPI003C7DF96F
MSTAISDEAGDGAKAPRRNQAAELTRQAQDHIRDLIMRRELLPGEKIGQVELARKVGVSRSPLREALRTLESEGIVSYEKNRGYIVARLDVDELAQVYRLRAIIEAELLLSVTRPTPADLTELESLNASMASAMEIGDITDLLRFNREFHFAIFDLSPLNLFRREARRLWHLSEGYRATYLWLPETRRRIVNEHASIVDSLRRFDLAALVELCSGHRSASEDVVVGLLAAPR